MCNEEQLIKKCKKNDRNAQKLLYQKYAALLLGICMRYSNNYSEAEDILQEGFCKILMKISQYKSKGSFEGWIRRIMVNKAITMFKKNCKHYQMQNIDEIVESDFNNQHEEEPEFSQEELLKIINSLPDGYRMVFNLYAVEGYKHREIASMLDIDENTSKSQYSRARKIIQKKLNELKKEKSVA